MMYMTDLQPGDVLVTIGDPRPPLSIIHGIVCVSTDSPFPHAAIFESGTTQIAALGNGVQRRGIEEWDRFMLVLRHPSRIMASRALLAAIGMIGQPYDVWGAVLDGVQAMTGQDLPDTEGHGVVCSRLVAAAFETAGSYITTVKTADVLPSHLVENSTLEVIGYLRVR